jgi:tRNA (guanine6-N2)-methyltransferase
MFLPGLEEVVRDEVAERVPGAYGWRAVPGREDSIEGVVTGPLAPLLELTTVVAPFLVLNFPVRGPKSLLDGGHFQAIVDAMRDTVRLNRRRPPRSFRIEAAGRDSTVLRTLAHRLEEAGGLREDQEDGECVLRLRPTPGAEGWDVLVRLSTLPLSARPWRTEGYPAAVNATVAAAMVRLSRPRPADRVANLMCGSGTLLVERLLAAPARLALGVDTSKTAISAAAENLASAGLTDRAQLLLDDVRGDSWLAAGPFDCLYADPPWGDKSGRHGENEELHLTLLRRAYEGAAQGARFLVLTHEIRFMESCLRATRDLWRLESETRIFQKGHHPRVYLLVRQDPGPATAADPPTSTRTAAALGDQAASADPAVPADQAPLADPVEPRRPRPSRSAAVAASARKRLSAPDQP